MYLQHTLFTELFVVFQLLTAYVVKEDVIQHFVKERTKISQSLQSFEKLHILRILLLCKDR